MVALCCAPSNANSNIQSYDYGWGVKLMVHKTLIVPSSLLKMTEELIV
uniref:Uncharacterized protein n=1 Tax=Setaria italica TaxID=4555 RepID=K3ZPE2_SETIT